MHVQDADTIARIKKSYFHILSFLLSSDTVKSTHVRCILRWGLQLNLRQEDITAATTSGDLVLSDIQLDKVERMEAIYHLVCLINQDTVTEDVELQVASLYAAHLGFPRTIVSDLLSAIATAGDDETSSPDWKQQVLDFLRVQNL